MVGSIEVLMTFPLKVQRYGIVVTSVFVLKSVIVENTNQTMSEYATLAVPIRVVNGFRHKRDTIQWKCGGC